MESINNNRLLRLTEVATLTSLGKSTINLWVAQGKFPAPTTLSPTIKVWRLGDIEQWIDKACSKEIAHLDTGRKSSLNTLSNEASQKLKNGNLSAISAISP